MMKKKILGLCIILATGLVACQKSDVTTTSATLTSSLKSTALTVSDIHTEAIADESQYEADLLSNADDIFGNIASGHSRLGKYLELKGNLRYLRGHCPDVVIDTAATGYPITISLNYGDSTVLKNGRTVKGLIDIVISGPKKTDGTTRTITYTDFSVDSVVVNGTITELFNGDDSLSRKITVNDDITFKYPDGTEYERVGQRVHNWLEGISTPLDPEDDKIEITGDITVKSSLGDTYVKSITEPLIRLGSCRFYVQGITQITLNSEVISTLNYGDGTCDNQAVLTVSGKDSTITFTKINPGKCHDIIAKDSTSTSNRNNSGNGKKKRK